MTTADPPVERLSEREFERLVARRVHAPQEISAALLTRKRRSEIAPDGVLFLVAADHPARGALGVGADPLAMANRRDLLSRLAIALDNERVDGVLASADIIEDLVLLGLLEGRVAIGTMNRGGLFGATWEIDDRMTAYDAEHVLASNLDGGKVLLRIDDEDAGTARTVEACGRAVTELGDRHLMAMVEPLPYTKNEDGLAVVDRRPASLVRAVAVASGLGATSAFTWLKVPSWPSSLAALSASSCPALILGGPLEENRAETFASWRVALQHPNCRGLVIGRTLLYPPDGNVADGVATVAALVAERVSI